MTSSTTEGMISSGRERRLRRRALEVGALRRSGGVGLCAAMVASLVVGIPVVPGVGDPPPAIAAAAATTTRVSLTSTNAQASGSAPSVSPDGRWVAFVSASTSLGVTNGRSQVFLRDTQANTTSLVSANTGGQPGNGDSARPAVSANGGYVFFDSAASDLIGGDTNGRHDVFVRNTAGSTTSRVSLGPAGVVGNGDSFNASITSAATMTSGKVAFTSAATNFGGACNGADCNGVTPDVFVRDLGAATTTLVSLETPNVPPSYHNNQSMYPQFHSAETTRQAISADGRYVVFSAQWGAGALHDDGCSGTFRVAEAWVYDFTNNQVAPLTWSFNNAPDGLGCYTQTVSTPNHNSPSISADGSTVAYVRRDRGVAFRSPTGALLSDVPLAADAPVADPVLNAAGTRAALSSSATTLVAGDTNGREDVFIVDRYGVGAIRASLRNDGTQVSTFPAGSAAGSFSPAIAGDGSSVVFTSWGSDLVSSDTNNNYDVFSRSGLPAPVAPPITPAERRGGSNAGAPCSKDLSPLVNCTRYPVDASTGNFWHTFEDFAIPGRGKALHLTHTYNSTAAAEDSPLGFGWTFSYNMSLSIGPGAATVTVRQENGAQIPFTLVGGVYRAAPRYPNTLVRNGDGTWTFTRLAREIFTFDASGALTSERDLNGYVTTVTRPNASTMVVTEPAGRTLTFAYSGSRITSVTDTASPPRVVRFEYNDGAGNLTDVIDVGGGKTHMTYDTTHRMLTMLDPAQAGSATPIPVTNHYDAQGRADWQKDFLGRQTSFDYTSVPGATKITDPKGNATLERYTNGLVTSITKAYGTTSAATWALTWDPVSSRLASVTDPKTHTKRWTSDERGNILTATDGLNRTTTWTYNALNQPLTMKDAKTVTTTYDYDAAGNLKSASTPYVEGGGTQASSYTYGDATHPGDITAMIDANQKTWSYTYDAAGNLATVTDPLTPTRGTTRFCYDGVGRPTATISPNGSAAGVTCTSAAPAPFTTYTTYNPFGDVLAVTDPLGHRSVRTYDADRRLKTAKDAEDNLTTYTYDTDGQLTDVLRADNTLLRYDYWPDGSLHHSFDGANKATSYTYDPHGRLWTETDPVNRKTTYAYDDAGNVANITQPGGNCATTPKTRCVTYGHNDADQVTSVTYSDTPSANITNVGYDDNGQRTSMTEASGTSSWAWDSLNRLSASSTPGQAVSYGYDLKNQLTRITYPGTTGSVTRGYDEAGRLRSVTDWGSRRTDFLYDADGFMTTQTFPAANGIVTTHTPDGAGRLMGITEKKGTATLASFTYGRDDNDQVTSVSSTGVPADNHSYSYTQLNQLKTVDGAAYTYDAADNLTRLPSGTNQAYDDANQLCWGATATGTCAPPPAEATTYGFDSRGNRTSVSPPGVPATTLTYDQANRLTKTAPTNPNQGQYTPLTPARILDTRAVWRTGVCPGATCATLGAGQTLTLKVAGQGGVPATGAAAAVVSVVATNTSAVSFLTLWPSDHAQPATSTLNWSANKTVSNLATVKLAADGTIKLYNLAGNVDVVIDVNGWYSASNGTTGSGFNALNPARILDTRAAFRTGSCPPATCTTMGTGTTMKLQVTGQGGVPATGVSAVAINITVTSPSTGGFLTVWPSNEARPPTSSVNFAAGVTFSELVIAKVAPDGTVSIYNNNGTVEVIADVSGWYGAGSGASFQPLNPARILDTRAAFRTGTCTGTCQTIPAGGTLVLSVAGKGGVPATGASAVVLNVVADGAVNGGFLTVWPADVPRPVTSQLTYDPGQTAANATITKLAANGTIAIYASNGPVDVIVDVVGYFVATAPTVTYAYNGDGLRTSKTVAGQSKAMAWDQSHGVPLLLSDGTNSYVYGPGGRPLEQIDAAGTVSYFHHDQGGSTRQLSNASGAIVATYTYDAYGKATASTGAVITPLRYAGEYTDAETGLVYLRARYYDPATGQFISRDPLTAMTGNAYGYVGGNPLNLVDPLGLCGWRDPWNCVDDAWDATGGKVVSGAWEHRDLVSSGLAVTSGVACLVGTGGTGALICGALFITSVGLSFADAKADGDMGDFYLDVGLDVAGLLVGPIAKGDDVVKVVLAGSITSVDALLDFIEEFSRC